MHKSLCFETLRLARISRPSRFLRPWRLFLPWRRSRSVSLQMLLPVLLVLHLPGVGDAAARQRKVAPAGAGTPAAATQAAGAVVIRGQSGPDAAGASTGKRSAAGKKPSAGNGKPLGLKRRRPPVEVRVISPDGREAVFRGVRERQPRGTAADPRVIRLRVGTY